MPRDVGTQAALLDAVVERLRQRIEEYTAKTCFVSDEAVPLSFPHGKFLCSVAPIAGQFDPGLMVGGGAAQVTEVGGLVVTSFVQMLRDTADHAEIAMAHAESGLIRRFKHKILHALLIDHQAASGLWEPRYKGQEFLRDGWLAPTVASAPTVFMPNEANNPYAMLSITFGASWDWDLTGVP